jgi:hypothetical protein
VSPKQTPSVTYGPAQWARPSFTGGFPGSAFTPQPDGTLRCPADRPLSPQERRPERDGSLRILYAARMGHCRDWTAAEHSVKKAPKAASRGFVSAVLWPLSSSLLTSSPTRPDAPAPLPLAPVFWKDWPRCGIRRGWLKVVRSETVRLESSTQPSSVTTPLRTF